MTEEIKNKKKSTMIIEKDRPFFSPMSMWREIDNAFDAFRRQFENHLWHPFRPFVVPHALSHRTRMPAMDFKDENDKFVLTMEIPGITKQDIDITLTEYQIEIKVEKEEGKKEEGECYVCQERISSNFKRVFEFPEEIVVDNSDATLENGILEISLPKKVPEPKREARKLDIK